MFNANSHSSDMYVKIYIYEFISKGSHFNKLNPFSTELPYTHKESAIHPKKAFDKKITRNWFLARNEFIA